MSYSTHRLIVWLVVLGCGALLTIELAGGLRSALDEPWNDARLAPTVAMLQGMPIWIRHGEGPLLDMIYGPVAALIWTPAGLQVTPTNAVLVGLAEAFLLVTLPVVAIVWLEARRHPALAASTVLLVLALLLSSPVLPGLRVQVDAPALGFGTVALACVWTERRRQSAVWRWAGAAAVVAAVGSKQVIVPLLVAYPAWIAIASGWRTAARALSAIAVIGLASILIIATKSDVTAMIDAAILGPARQPFVRGGTTADLVRAGVDLTRRGLPAACVLGIAAWLQRRRHVGWARLARAHRWTLPLAVALACVPLALLGRMKVGGGPNTLAVSIWFLVVAMAGALAAGARRGARIRPALTTLALLPACVLALRLAPALRDLPRQLQTPPLPSVAFDAAREAPDTIYFPFRPTTSLLAEGRAYHFVSGIWFRELEGRHVDEGFVRAFLPPALERIAIDRRYAPRMLKYLPTFSKYVTDPSLPGFIVIVEDDVMPADGIAAIVEQLDQAERTGRVAETGRTAPPAGSLRTRIVDPPGSPVRVYSAAVTTGERERRYRVGLSAEVGPLADHEILDVEVRLLDEQHRHLATLAAGVRPDAERRVAVEWPLLDEPFLAAVSATVLVRGGRRDRTGEGWHLPATDVLDLVYRRAGGL